MTDQEIVSSYSNTALAGVIRSLEAMGSWWTERLEAARHELAKRRIQELQQDQESFQ